MNSIKTGALFAGVLFFAGVQADIVSTQEAIEAVSLQVHTGNSGKGHVVVRSCRDCPFVRLETTPATVISVDGEYVSADKQINRSWPGGVVIYDVESRQVVKLKL